jgi:predicted ATPase
MDWGLSDDARHIIESQFESLGPADRALLEAASVSGAIFSAAAVAAALGWAVDEVEERCESLVGSHRFLSFDGVAGSYAFIHELYRTGVYAAVPEGRRRRLHRRIGEFLEAQSGERAGDIVPTWPCISSAAAIIRGRCGTWSRPPVGRCSGSPTAKRSTTSRPRWP